MSDAYHSKNILSFFIFIFLFLFFYFWLSLFLVILFILISSHLLNSFTEFCGCNSLKILVRQHSSTGITYEFNGLLHMLSAIVSPTKVDQDSIFRIFSFSFSFRIGFCSRTCKKQAWVCDVCTLYTCFASLLCLLYVVITQRGGEQVTS